VLQTVLTAAIAATVAFLFSILNESLRERRAFRHRWDREVRELASDYLAATRRLMHLAGSTAHLSDDATELRDALQDVRMKCSQLLLLADPELAEAAVKVQSEAYAVVRAKIGQAAPAHDRISISELYEAVREFVLRARTQLALPEIARVRRAAYGTDGLASPE
jgi:hypothetical protein